MGFLKGPLLAFAIALAFANGSSERSGATASAAGADHLVFTSDRDGDRDVYAVDAHGGRVAALTRNRVDDYLLAVAPTGEVLASRINGGAVVSPDGRRERKLGLIGLDGVLSHDGSLFAVDRFNPVTENSHIVLVPVRGGRMQDVGNGGPELFSRDGRYLAIGDERGPGIIELGTRRRQSLPQPPERYRWAPNLDWLAYEYDDYSPGGTQLVVMGGRSRGAKRTVTRGDFVWEWIGDNLIGASRVKDGIQDLVVLDVARGTEHVLATQDLRGGGAEMYRAEWSPKGDAVAYIKNGNLVVARLDGGSSEVNLRSGYEYATLTWAPRGDRIAISGGAELDVVDLEPTPQLRRVATGIDGYPAVWSPDERWLALERSSGITIVSTAGGSAPVFVRVANPQDLSWASGALPRAARTAPPPPQLQTRTVRLRRTLPSSGTLLTVRGSIDALAQDGDRVAWVRRTSGPFASVIEVLDIRRATRTVIGGLKRSADALNPGLYPAAFALAGGRIVLIDLTGGACGLSTCYFDTLTASLGDRRLRTIDAMEYATDEHAPGLDVLAAGDSRSVLYYERCFSSEDCGGPGSVVRRVSGRRPVDVLKLADDRYPTALAVAGSRFAIADRTAVAKTTVVSIRAVRNGRPVTQFGVAGVVSELALSPQRVAVLVNNRIELHDARTGTPLGSVHVGHAANLSIDGAAIVFKTGRTIRLLNARTRQVSALATALAHSTGLSVERGRVAWAEDTHTGARIRVLRLPATSR